MPTPCARQGEAGTGNVVEAVRHARAVMGAIRQLQSMDDDELYVYAKEIRAPVELVRQTKHLGRLPVVNFAAGGVATPADAALMMQLGMDGVFVGSGIFKSGDPSTRARAIVQVRAPAGQRRLPACAALAPLRRRLAAPCAGALRAHVLRRPACALPLPPPPGRDALQQPQGAGGRQLRPGRAHGRHRREGEGLQQLRQPVRVMRQQRQRDAHAAAAAAALARR